MYVLIFHLVFWISFKIKNVQILWISGLEMRVNDALQTLFSYLNDETRRKTVASVDLTVDNKPRKSDKCLNIERHTASWIRTIDYPNFYVYFSLFSSVLTVK